MLVRQTRRSVSCSSAFLLLLSSVGWSAEDPWLKYTTEAAQLRRDGLNSEAEARYVSAYRAVADTAESGRLGSSLIDLANLYTDMGRYADAEIAAQRALKVYRKISDPKSTAVATAQNSLAEIYRIQGRSVYLMLGRYIDAEIVARRAMAILEQAKIRHPVDLALAIQNLAYLSVRREQYAEAEALYKRALDSVVQALGSQHANLAPILMNLGKVYCYQGRYTDADALLRRSLEIRVAAFGADSFPVAEVLYDEALVLRKLDRKSEAKKFEARALAIRAAHTRENLERYTVEVSALRAR